MKKVIAVIAGVVVLCTAIAGVLTACSNSGTATVQGEGQPGAASSLTGSLNLTGSTSMADVCNALAEQFQAAYPGVTPSVGGNGSGEAPTAVESGTAQIGLLSRELKTSENPDNYNVYKIGLDGIAMIVHPHNGISDLTVEQIARIYTGEITNWKELGGEDLAIVPGGRESASGTRAAFEEIVTLNGKNIVDRCKYANEYNATGALKQATAGNPGAIGYVSLSAVDDTVKAVRVAGAAPSEAAVKDGSYAIQRPFVMITKKENVDAITKAFLRFIASDAGQKIIQEDGVVPLKITVK